MQQYAGVRITANDIMCFTLSSPPFPGWFIQNQNCCRPQTSADSIWKVCIFTVLRLIITTKTWKTKKFDSVLQNQQPVAGSQTKKISIKLIALDNAMTSTKAGWGTKKKYGKNHPYLRLSNLARRCQQDPQTGCSHNYLKRTQSWPPHRTDTTLEGTPENKTVS